MRAAEKMALPLAKAEELEKIADFRGERVENLTFHVFFCSYYCTNTWFYKYPSFIYEENKLRF